jgi:4-amino-4-deoxy-L-arabinose transferase-like glycosyltransferase
MPLLPVVALLTAGLAAGSLICHRRRQYGLAVLWLMGAAFGLRLLLIGADPFLHDWDERFHALVAKNMLANGFLRPLLRAHPVLPYDYQQWCCNHVWLHKQPLFLWQLALSLKVFGSNESALRLPSALLGSLVLWPGYRLGRLVFGPAVGYHAAWLLAVAYYQLELTTGWQSVDHADVAFMSYVTASVWAYYESRQPTARAGWWSLLAGVLAGAAVLCKWLPGLVVYVAWGLELLRHPAHRRQPGAYLRLAGALAATLLVALPWQFYTYQQFPLESAFERAYASQHFGQELEGQGGPWYFYLTQNMWYQYQWLTVLLGAGLGLLLARPYRHRPMRPLLVVCGVVFGFFSLAATKMPSYTYVVAPLLLVPAAVAWVAGLNWVGTHAGRWRGVLKMALSGLVVVLALRPSSLLKHHTDRWAAEPLARQRKKQHRAVYARLDALVPADCVLFGVPALEEVEAMFYAQRPVYAGLPTPAECQTLRAQGLRVAVLPTAGGPPLPAYLARQALVLPAPLE